MREDWNDELPSQEPSERFISGLRADLQRAWVSGEDQLMTQARPPQQAAPSRLLRPVVAGIVAAAAALVTVVVISRPSSEISGPPEPAVTTDPAVGSTGSTSTVAPEAPLDARAAIPEVFPSFLPSEPNGARMVASYGGFMSFPDGHIGRALVGRIEDGLLIDAVVVGVASDLASPPSGDTTLPSTSGDEVVIDGVTYEVRREPGERTLVLRGGLDVLVTGADPEAFVEAAGGIPVAAIDPVPGGWTFALGPLPAGYEVIVPPVAFPTPPYLASLQDTAESGPGVEYVRTSRLPELLVIGLTAPLRQVDIGGVTGWELAVVGASGTVFWKVADHTWATASAGSPDEARALARSVVFVDEATWVDTYDICADADGWQGPPAYCVDGRPTRTSVLDGP
jgi:hypothetical protein